MALLRRADLESWLRGNGYLPAESFERAARKTARKPVGFDPDAEDRDNDGLVQDATLWERPAVPKAAKKAAPRKAAPRKAAPPKKAAAPRKAAKKAVPSKTTKGAAGGREDDRPGALGEVPAGGVVGDDRAAAARPRAKASGGDRAPSRRPRRPGRGEPAAGSAVPGTADEGGDRPGVGRVGGAEGDAAGVGGPRRDVPVEAPPVFRPSGQHDLAPAKEADRLEANLEALRTLRRIQREERPATAAEQAVLARWSGWGALPKVFDEPPVEKVYKDAQRELREGVDGRPPLLPGREFDAARRTIRNAHYTDAAYVSAIWDALRELGFDGGEVLEPGSGSGNFMGLVPEDIHGDTHITGVELDPITAAIAQALYPDQDVRVESFAETQVPDGSFDAAVGNVPFASTTLVDPQYNPGRRHSMHNHFILKALRMTRPGGLVAVLTSRYTMDGEDPKSRREMARLGDLVGAVRLPSGAHEAAAGTSVVTDLLIFRRREDGAEPAGFPFEETRRVTIDGREVAVNEMFLDNPELVLGRLKMGSGTKDFFHVVGDKAAGPALREALASIVARAREQGLVQTPGRKPRPKFRAPAAARKMKGTITAHPDGTFTRAESDEWGYPREVPYKVKPSEAAELRSLLRLRDVALALREAEARDDEPEMDRLRAELNKLYDEHVGQRREDGTWTGFGPVSRYTETRRKAKKAGASADDEATEETVTRRRPGQGGFRRDPFSAVVRVLEEYDPVTGDAKKTSIFRERQFAPRRPAERADTPADALAISLDTHGYVDLDTVAELLDADPAQAREMLGDLVYDEPGTDRLIPRAEYLSGNVREKLDAARRAAATDDRYQANVDALERVLPEDVTPEQIRVQMGATWIDAKYVQQFLREILHDQSITVVRSGGAHWDIRGGGDKKSAAATNEWGTEEFDALKVAYAVLNDRPISVKVEGSDSATADKTAAAQEKAAAMRERFEEWLWQDPARTKALVEAYNRAFNSLVLRSYDGSYLTLPGMAQDFEPHPHVRDAVARIIQAPSVGLWHAVGAGKSAEMIIGAMELRRLGLVRKPAIVVPNHMLEQMTREFIRIYPQARVLAIGSEDIGDVDKKREVIAAAADPQYDVVIITHGAFKRIPTSVETEEAYMRSEVESRRRAHARRRKEVIRQAQAAAEAEGIDDADEVDKRIRKALAEDTTTKELEARIQAREEGIKAKLTERLEIEEDAEGVGRVTKRGISRDPGLTFEQTGIDYLFVDEAHLYKNLSTASDIEGMGIAGSQIASDLHMKLHYLRERYDRVATLATGTPIANSIREAYTMLRYLRPDLLQELGIETFDEFASNFGEVVSRMEVSPTGSLRVKPRFARFVNVPEFLRPWLIAGDVMTSDDLLEVRDRDGNPIMRIPRLAEWTDSDGKTSRTPELVVVPSSEVLRTKVESLAYRAEHLPPGPPRKGDDNMLSITGEGRAAALDLRLVGLDTDEPQKLDIAADRIAGIYDENKDRVYTDRDGNPVGQPGALQLVFSDLGTPTTRRKKKGAAEEEFSEGSGATADFDVYTALRDKLVARGVPREKIAFIHDAKTDQEKAELFAAARDGRIAVLIGSTQKMGVGTNIQDRAVALHHLDAPWRPADIEQREGRIVRHGNQNPEVRVIRYVTEGSFDAYIWQAITTKGTYINQVMRGQLDVREMDDVGEFVLTATQAVALGTGNPYLIEHADALAELTRLERKRRNHEAEQKNLARIIQLAEADAARAERHIAAIDEALPKRRNTRGDAFEMTIGDAEFGPDDRPDAQEALRQAMLRVARSGTAEDAGALGGFTVRVHQSGYGIEMELVGVPGRIGVGLGAIRESDNIGKLQRKLETLEQTRAALVSTRERALDDVEHSRARVGAPFRDEAALAEARARFEDVDARLSEEMAKRGQSVESLDPEAQAAANRARERAELEEHLAAGGGFTSIGQLTVFLEGDEARAEEVAHLKRVDGPKWGVLSPAGLVVVVKGSGQSGDKFRVAVPRTLREFGDVGQFRTQTEAKRFAAMLESAGIPLNTGVDLDEWRDPQGRTVDEIVARLRASDSVLDGKGEFGKRAVRLEIQRRVPDRLKKLLDPAGRGYGPLRDLGHIGTGTQRYGYTDADRARDERRRDAILRLLEAETGPDGDMALADRLREWGLSDAADYSSRRVAFELVERLENDYRARNPQLLDPVRSQFAKMFADDLYDVEAEQRIYRILNDADRDGDFTVAVARLRTLADELPTDDYYKRKAADVARSLADRLESLGSGEALRGRREAAADWDRTYKELGGTAKVWQREPRQLVEEARFEFLAGRYAEATERLRRIRRDHGTYNGLIDAMMAVVTRAEQGTPAEAPAGELVGAGARSGDGGLIRVSDLPAFLRSLGVLPGPTVDERAVRLFLAAFERDAMSTASEASLLGEQYGPDDDDPPEDDPGFPIDDMDGWEPTDADYDGYDEPDGFTRADVNPKPGDNNLRKYWVYGKGRRKWRRWRELYKHLIKYLKEPERTKRVTSAWFKLRYGYHAGSDINRVKWGKPPRGKLIGPG